MYRMYVTTYIHTTMSRSFSTHWEKKYAFLVLVGKPKRKRPLGRTSCKRVDNIKMFLREIGWVHMDRIHLIQVKDQWGCCEHGIKLSVTIKCW
jgi:hypothetical protein